MRATTTIAIAAAFSVAACELFVDTGGLSSSDGSDGGNVQDGAPDAPSSDGAGGDSGGGTDASSGDATTDAAEGGCPGKAGPAMVSAGTYCIDSTEVTNAQYDAFLAASPPATLQPQACAFNTTYARKCSTTSGPKAAVACVNWCDAYAYCAWAGKRLCGAIGGGSTPSASLATASVDQWYQACSKNGTLTFSYGNSAVSGRCNDSSLSLGKTVDVGSYPSCVGGYPGLFDMVGNAVEWEDSCDAANGANDTCYIRSSAYDDPEVACSSSSTQARNSADATKGFRCCGP